MRLWINAAGVVVRSELLTSTGTENRDAALYEAIRALAIGAPPADLPQPVTLLVTS